MLKPPTSTHPIPKLHPQGVLHGHSFISGHQLPATPRRLLQGLCPTLAAPLRVPRAPRWVGGVPQLTQWFVQGPSTSARIWPSPETSTTLEWVAPLRREGGDTRCQQHPMFPPQPQCVGDRHSPHRPGSAPPQGPPAPPNKPLGVLGGGGGHTRMGSRGWESGGAQQDGGRALLPPPATPKPALGGAGQRCGSSMGGPVAGWDQDKGPERDTHQDGGHGRGGG